VGLFFLYQKKGLHHKARCAILGTVSKQGAQAQKERNEIMNNGIENIMTVLRSEEYKEVA